MNGKFLNKWMSVLLRDSHWVPSFQTGEYYFVTSAVHILAINILTNKGT